MALCLISGVVLSLAFVPALFAAPSPAGVLLLGAMSLCISAIFIAIGLAVGFATADRGRGLLGALMIWLLLLVGFDLAAWFAAQFEAVQRMPGLWLSLLLFNPLDAVRIATLFALEEIPFSVPGENKVVALWSAHLRAWVFVLTAAWVAVLLAWCRFQLTRKEV